MFWSPIVAIDVLTLAAAPDGFAGPTRAALPQALDDRLAPEGEHVLLADLAAQLWLFDKPAAGSPLSLMLPLDEAFLARLDTALAFWRLMRGERATTRALTPQRRARLILGLRALDGRAEGASYREIAVALFGAAHVPDSRAWKTHDLRSRTLRLVAGATALMRGGYRSLLR